MNLEETLRDAGWKKTRSGHWVHQRLNQITPGSRARLVSFSEALEWQESWDRAQAAVDEASAVT